MKEEGRLSVERDTCFFLQGGQGPGQSKPPSLTQPRSGLSRALPFIAQGGVGEDRLPRAKNS